MDRKWIIDLDLMCIVMNMEPIVNCCMLQSTLQDWKIPKVVPKLKQRVLWTIRILKNRTNHHSVYIMNRMQAFADIINRNCFFYHCSTDKKIISERCHSTPQKKMTQKTVFCKRTGTVSLSDQFQRQETLLRWALSHKHCACVHDIDSDSFR